VAAIPPVATAAGRAWRFLRRPATHRFLAVAGVAGAVVVSLISSGSLLAGWERERAKEEAAAAFFLRAGATRDVVMSNAPLAIHELSGNPAIGLIWDPFPVMERVVRAYDVRWMVVTIPDGAERDPLGLWEGGESVDREGNRATWLASEPAFEADGVRVYEVVGG
jgi:hypothetical protein